MKALLITSRSPWPPFTGDRVRATIWIAALKRGGIDVDIIAPPRFSITSLLRALFDVMRNKLPLQTMLAAPYDWRNAIERAKPFDVAIVLLSRMHPWVRLEGRTILDAIDSLRRSAEERAKAAGAPTRWFWRIEERRMARLEADASRVYDRVIVVSEEERGEFDGAIAVTNGIEIAPLDETPRAFDFGFWGRLPYFANADAARWLLDEIWPRICEQRSATLVIGGAGAPRWLRIKAARLGVAVVSPIDDVPAFARNIRVALMPLRYGSGQSNKILEAAEAGCAIVATPQAMRGLPLLAEQASIATTADQIANAAIMIDRAPGMPLRRIVESHYGREATLDRLAAIARGDA